MIDKIKALEAENKINRQAALNGDRKVKELQEILKEPLNYVAEELNKMKIYQAGVLEKKNKEIDELKNELNDARDVINFYANESEGKRALEYLKKWK